MMRLGPALSWVLLVSACSSGEPWRITDSTTTLGGGDTESDASGPVISISASASGETSSSGASADTTSATTKPVDGSSGSGEASSTAMGGESSTGSTSGEGSSSTGDSSTIDLSGWSIVQTDSARTFEIPDGTRVPIGGALIIARDADQASFEAYWGVTFGPDVVFVSASDDFPIINGDETYALRDAASTVVDGPTPAILEEESLDRVDPEDDTATGWMSASADVGTPTPGTSTEPPAGFTGVFLSEVSDAIGVGNFVYEFVELRAF